MSIFAANPVPKSFPIKGNCEVKLVTYNAPTLVVELNFYDKGKIGTVSFNDIVGFRLLDEGDLCSFWTKISLKVDWLFEVETGGWFSLESKREDFLSRDNVGIREYLVISDNDCINVLCYSDPTVALNDAT